MTDSTRMTLLNAAGPIMARLPQTGRDRPGLTGKGQESARLSASVPSTAEEVAQVLARDGVARDGLRRGIINVRALARWMIATHGWAASEEAVLSALRRSPWTTAPPDPNLKKILQTSHINTTSNVASVMLRGGLSTLPLSAPLARLLKEEPAQFLRLAVSNDNARLVVHGDQLPKVKRALEGMIDEVREGLTEISINQTRESLNAPGVVAYIVGALSFQGINFFGIIRHKLALQLLVNEADTARALHALGGVLGPRGAK